MKNKERFTEQDWLDLLQKALNEGVEIQVNHRFKYNVKNLGTFLTSAKSRNKTELIEKIESLGVNYKMHSKKPEDYLERIILKLSADKKPRKHIYITGFNNYIVPKKDVLKKSTIKKFNLVWKEKFGDDRKWEIPETADDKVRRWKEFRYDTIKNPEGKWGGYRSNMGKLYNWIYQRKNNPEKMNLLAPYFNIMELAELADEGYKCK